MDWRTILVSTEPGQPVGRLGQDLVPLAEGEPDLSPSGIPVVVEHHIRHRDDAAAIRQALTELKSVRLAQRGGLRGVRPAGDLLHHD
jgi:hypothetical protein